MAVPKMSSFIVLATAAWLGGCGGGGSPTEPLTGETFLTRPARGETPPATSQSIAPAPDDASVQIPFLRAPQALPATDVAAGGDVAAVGDVVEPVAAGPAATGPAAPAQAASDEPLPAGRRLEPGQYQIIGFVVAEVNGTPIYADRVLSLLKSPLAAEAKRNSPEMFRAFATRLIADKVNELKVNELEVAAATTGLAAEDKRVADLLTMQWRAQQITNAGGSPQLAKQKAEQNGEDWEDLVDRVYRAKLIEVFYRKRIVPLIAVSATDVRDYYARNVGKQFTEHGQATFRVIKIGRRPGESADAALARATKLQAQAAGDADFAQLAASDANDDKALRARGGLFENIQAGAFRLAEVDKKVWDTKPGDVTPVVQDQGGFYVAKVEAMTAGSVKPFESLEVQDGIRNLLWRQQFAKHRQAIQEDLIKKAVIRGSDADVAKVVDMAMQDYRRWAQL